MGQLQQEGADAARAGTHQRLTLLDERILQIERDQALTERLLSNAPPDVLSLTAEPPERDQGPVVSEDAAVLASFGTFTLGVLLTMLVGRVRRGRLRRRTGAASSAAMLGDDPRIDQLTQAVDAIAVEVERIGEGQRFVTQLLAVPRDAPVFGAEGEWR